MKTDTFREQYEDLLSGSYDCADRIVLNAYFPLAQSPGGFRTWWRVLHGNDDSLDDTALTRYAGDFSRKIRAFAEKRKIPLIFCQTGDRKHEIAEKLMPKDPAFCGLFCILVGRAPAPVRTVQRFGETGRHIIVKKPYPYVNHYSFHILDRQWGHITIKLCPHPPFNAQIILNGHEFVERAACKRGISFTKDGNCFTSVSNSDALTRVADAMADTGGRLVQVCERWIYSCCLSFALNTIEQERCGFRYAYSVYQAEYSRNYLFARGRQMEELFEALIDRTRVPLDLKTVKTIFGFQRRPFSRKSGGKSPRMELAIEKPTYNLTVFKIHFGLLTVKMYSKGERVLRVEVITHNASRMDCGYGIGKLPAILSQLRDILNRFVQVLHCVDASFVEAAALDKWPMRTTLNGKPVAGVDINRPRMRAVAEAVVALAPHPKGFKAADVAEHIRSHLPAFRRYHARQAAYDLRKLRAKRVVRRIPNTLRYETECDGIKSITALLVLRNKVLIPLLANGGYRKRVPKCHMSEMDLHYDIIQREMQSVFNSLGIAA